MKRESARNAAARDREGWMTIDFLRGTNLPRAAEKIPGAYGIVTVVWLDGALSTPLLSTLFTL